MAVARFKDEPHGFCARRAQVIMEKEAQNPEFAFLYNLASPEHAYYRWRLFSLSQGPRHTTTGLKPTQDVAILKHNLPHMASVVPCPSQQTEQQAWL
jgi:hypothetical protein